MLSSAVIEASVLLFVGGALTALGFERLFWSARSGIAKKKETIVIDA